MSWDFGGQQGTQVAAVRFPIRLRHNSLLTQGFFWKLRLKRQSPVFEGHYPSIFELLIFLPLFEALFLAVESFTDVSFPFVYSTMMQ